MGSGVRPQLYGTNAVTVRADRGGGGASGADRYVPAAGRDWLTGVYDIGVVLTMREPRWRRTAPTPA